MGRKLISIKASYAFYNRVRFSQSNTKVKTTEDGKTILILFGNPIAIANPQGFIEFTLRGWNTVTTRERLSALGIDIQQRNGVPLVDGHEITPYSWCKTSWSIHNPPRIVVDSWTRIERR